MLKGVIFSVEDTIVTKDNQADENLRAELGKLAQYLRQRGIGFVVFTNRDWKEKNTNRTLQEALFESWGDFKYFSRLQNPNVPPKPSQKSTEYILKEMGWAQTEVLYIGASENDMITAVNGKLLFLRAKWYSDNIDYGFAFDTPKAMAKFIDTFCLREHDWCHEINNDGFKYYALAPFSTYKPEYTLYSEDARSAAKKGQGHQDFWIGAIVSSLYFSGLYLDLKFITVYPGHKSGSGNKVMDSAISIFGKCFRIKYISNLIIRHTDAIKSQTARNTGIAIDHLNQLNTINLNEKPNKSDTQQYANRIPLKGKTVLVLDDIATRGYSFEAARAFLEAAGANVVLVSWLKTINTDIDQIKVTKKFNPFEPNVFSLEDIQHVKTHSYHANIIDSLAPVELTELFQSYLNWDWPN